MIVTAVAVSVAVKEIKKPRLRKRPGRESQVIAGGAEGTRTPDPHTASVVRYQLRHGPRCPVAGHCAIVHSRPSAVTSDRRTASVPTKGSTQDQFIVGSGGKIATA